MARAENAEIIDRFEEFYRTYYRDEIGELAQKYPSDRRSLYVDWGDLYRFDSDLAEDYRTKPDQMRDYAEETLRLYDLPVDVKLGRAHVRVHNLGEITEIREIRARHRGQLIEVQGIVRKATDVRPKITEAAFECQRCGTLTHIPQHAGGFQEPHECQGCERQGPFKLNFDQSEFVDSQKLRVQESPEGLRGGETPQSIDVHIEDDITGEVTAGDHVRVVGVLHLDQQSSGREKSTVFDKYLDGVSVEIEDEQFEDMDITEEDKREIVELSGEPNIYEQMVDSVAPSIYGMNEEKMAIILQLFSGVTKHLPDESRIRGDMHVLLLGEPGTAKCVSGDTRVTLGSGTEVPIRELVERHLDDPNPVDDGVYDEVDFDVPSLRPDGTLGHCHATRVWKRDAPAMMYRIRTASGAELEVTPSHPLYVQSGGTLAAAEASELREDQFIATPRHIPTDWDDTLDVNYRRSMANNPVRLDLPREWTPSLARLLGYIIGEGYAERCEDNSANVWITNDDREVLDDIQEAFDRLGVNSTEQPPRENKSARCVRCSASELVSFLENLEPAILERSPEQRVPDQIMQASPTIKRSFLRAYIEGEGTVSDSRREITVTSMSRELLSGVRSLLLSLGIWSVVSAEKNGSYRLRMSGSNFKEYVTDIGFVTERKTVASRAFSGTPENTNTDVIPNICKELRGLRERLTLSQFDCGVPRSTFQHYDRNHRNPSRESFQTVITRFDDRLHRIRDMRERLETGDWEDILEARRELNISQMALSEGMEVTQTAISYYERNDVVPDGDTVEDARAVALRQSEDALSVEPAVQSLESLAHNDIRWDRIDTIETLEPNYDWVYDLEIEDTHNYLTNNVISHNSQLLQYITNIAPRSVYTSGKGSSAAGLTAAAVRDDFAEGQQWTLEAGALVLADQGIAAVDELDKMEAGDRSAMHQALEQQSISISKAGINATLKSRCSLLGAANPKYGRFDEYEPIGEQIDLEPALISRFDLIFTVTDQPDEEKDRALAEHILETNYAGELHTHREQTAASNVSREDVETATEDVEPAIEADLLRKYIAYAKRNCYPTMTDAAKEAMQAFYVNLRARGEAEDTPVPVTARKLEALVRLSEASARVRLSDTVEEEDAERVIEIVRSCLEDVGMDPETGEFDADVIEAGTSKSQRDRIKNIKNLIADIESDYEEGAPVPEVLDRAEEIGMERSKAEHEIEKLRRQGDVYEPTTDHLRTV